MKKSGKKGKKCCYEDSNSNSELGVGLGSTTKVIKLGETVKNTSYTPPTPMKATPTSICSRPVGSLQAVKIGSMTCLVEATSIGVE